MRLHSLLALAATGALLLPLGANAGTVPPGYLTSCVASASAQPGMTKPAAEKHCSCSVNVIEKKFSDAEIKDHNSTEGVDQALKDKAIKLVTQACKAQK